jgi:hypothetical protein
MAFGLFAIVMSAFASPQAIVAGVEAHHRALGAFGVHVDVETSRSAAPSYALVRATPSFRRPG